MNIKLSASFDDIGSFLSALGGSIDDIPELGWHSLKKYVRPIIIDIIQDDNFPAPAIEAYFSMLTMLDALESVVAQAGDHQFRLNMQGLKLLDLLPTEEEIEEELERQLDDSSAVDDSADESQ